MSDGQASPAVGDVGDNDSVRPALEALRLVEQAAALQCTYNLLDALQSDAKKAAGDKAAARRVCLAMASCGGEARLRLRAGTTCQGASTSMSVGCSVMSVHWSCTSVSVIRIVS